jgi:hypothetical protein
MALGEGQDATHAPHPIQYCLLTFGKSLNLSGFSASSGKDFASKNASAQALRAKL